MFVYFICMCAILKYMQVLSNNLHVIQGWHYFVMTILFNINVYKINILYINHPSSPNESLGIFLCKNTNVVQSFVSCEKNKIK